MLKFIFFFAFFQNVSSNYAKVEDDCKFCTSNQSKIILQAIWHSNLQLSYSCRGSFAFASKFGIIVDHACSLEECKEITDRKFMIICVTVKRNLILTFVTDSLYSLSRSTLRFSWCDAYLLCSCWKKLLKACILNRLKAANPQCGLQHNTDNFTGVDQVG